MDETFEIIEDESEETESSGFSIPGFSGIWYYVLLFLVFIFLNSELFIDQVLDKISGTTDHKIITSKGIMVQATILVLIMIVVDLCIQAGFP